MAEEYRVVGESPTEVADLPWLYWEGDATTDRSVVLRYAGQARFKGDRNVKVERRGGPEGPWEALPPEIEESS